VSLVQLGVWLSGAVDDRFVVPKHVAHVSDWNAEVSQCSSKRPQVLAEMYSLPYVAVLTVACFLEYQSIGNLFRK
jgi:hypothetical protein